MRWLKAVVGEIFGLFVDDGAFAIAIIVWLGAVWQVLPWLGVPTAWGGMILFAGLAAILVESAARRSNG
jgi:hypothetical protein